MNDIREQIGWFNPGSKRFAYNDEKETRLDHFNSYTVPVYATNTMEKMNAVVEAARFIPCRKGPCVVNRTEAERLNKALAELDDE